LFLAKCQFGFHILPNVYTEDPSSDRGLNLIKSTFYYTHYRAGMFFHHKVFLRSLYWAILQLISGVGLNFFTLLGTTSIKAVRRMLMKLKPCATNTILNWENFGFLRSKNPARWSVRGNWEYGFIKNANSYKLY